VIEQYITQTEGLRLVAQCFNATEAFTILHQQKIDLIFLDIKMPAIKGTDFIRSLLHPPAFIFTTAYAEHAITGYELEAVDYLLKPITYERFSKSIARYLKQQLVVPQIPEKDYLYLKVNGHLVKLHHREMLFAQSMRDYIKVVTVSGSYLTHLTIKVLLDLLPQQDFKRVHRSYIVNMRHIDILRKDAVVINKTVIPVGDNYKTNLKNS
jgi:two-component system LytT family response regulator